MAMKKDGDKGKRTLSGKKPATFGGENSKLMKKKESALAGPRATPARPMGKDATGSANFTRTSPSRATVSVGPATLSVGGRTAKSTGGMNMTNGKVMPKKESGIMAKKSAPPTKGMIVLNQKEIDAQEARAKKSKNVAMIAGGTILGAGIALSGKKIGEKMGQAAKYIANTKERKAAKRAQKAENDAMIVERNKGKGTMKASKSTMKKLRGR
jgi:hypothetical protein